MKAYHGCSKHNKLKFALFICFVYVGIQLLNAKVSDLGRNRTPLSTNDVLDLEIFDQSPLPFAEPGNLSAPLHNNGKPTCQDELANAKITEGRESLQAVSWKHIEAVNQDVLIGGKYAPESCLANFKVAIIIPLRNREDQLKSLLSHMHPIWKRQMLDYRVYVISQAGDGLFNRAKLLNVGVAEASKDGPYDCYVFHDVDLLLDNDECMYSCELTNPRHISHHIDVFSYEPIAYYVPCDPSLKSLNVFSLLFPKFYGVEVTLGFGGVSVMTGEQFKSVNGFSNLYWGWGGEDDDMFHRIRNRGYAVVNPYGRKCSFTMIRHLHESGNAVNPTRFALLRHAVSRMDKDGFSSLRYRVMSKDLQRLYTNVTVDIGRPSAVMTRFITQILPPVGALACSIDMPWDKRVDAR